MGILSFLFGGGQAKAAKKAAEVQAKAAERIEGLAVEREGLSLEDLEAALKGALGDYGSARGALDPYAEAGTKALSTYQSVLGLGPPGEAENVLSALTNAPGYQFGLDQGVQALDRGANAGSGIYSGAQGKALTKFGQDYAGTKLDTVLDRIRQVASGGQDAATNQANIFTQQAGARLGTGENRANVRLGSLQTISDAIAGAAAARAGGITGAANARAGGTRNVLSALGNIGKFFLGGGLKLA